MPDLGFIRIITYMPAPVFAVGNANPEFDVPMEYEDIDLNQLANAILEHKHELMEHWNTEADFILMGEEEFRALTGTLYRHNIIEFTAQLPKDRTFLGLKIRVSPTISGWCVVPKAR